MKQPVFTGSCTALVTPFRPDGSICLEEMGRLIDYQIENGTDALLVCGTTGESASLTDDEKLRCISFAADRVKGRVPVLAGTGSNDTCHAMQLSRRAREMGADALLVVTPYYNKTSQAGLVQHFEAIANECRCPIVLYNVPSRTGMNLAPETLRRLCENPYITAVKEASGNLSQCVRMAALCKDEAVLYSGNDDQVLPLLAMGAKGVISVAANAAPRQMHALCQAWFCGDTETARSWQLWAARLSEALFCDVNPIPIKYAMTLLGWQTGRMRLPLVPPQPAEKRKIESALQACGLL